MRLYVEPMDAVVIEVTDDGRVRHEDGELSDPTLQAQVVAILLRLRTPVSAGIARVTLSPFPARPNVTTLYTVTASVSDVAGHGGRRSGSDVPHRRRPRAAWGAGCGP